MPLHDTRAATAAAANSVPGVPPGSTPTHPQPTGDALASLVRGDVVPPCLRYKLNPAPSLTLMPVVAVGQLDLHFPVDQLTPFGILFKKLRERAIQLPGLKIGVRPAVIQPDPARLWIGTGQVVTKGLDPTADRGVWRPPAPQLPKWDSGVTCTWALSERLECRALARRGSPARISSFAFA